MAQRKRLQVLRVLQEDSCPDCGQEAFAETCEDCGAVADVIECGHYPQPQPVAASAYGGAPVCDECERVRERTHLEEA